VIDAMVNAVKRINKPAYQPVTAHCGPACTSLCR
jgi:hypothetical protein